MPTIMQLLSNLNLGVIHVFYSTSLEQRIVTTNLQEHSFCTPVISTQNGANHGNEREETSWTRLIPIARGTAEARIL